MGEVENPPIDLSPYPPTPPAQYFYADLEYNPDGCHVVLSPQPLPLGFFDPTNFGFLCSFFSDLTCGIHEDQVFYGGGVEQSTFAIIFYEYVWESKQEYPMKDDLLLFAPRPLYPDILHSFSIYVPSCENSFPIFATYNHT